MDQNTLSSLLTLQMTPNLGAVNLKNLIAYCGSPQAVLEEKSDKLQRIPGIGQKTVAGIGHVSQKMIDQEIAFLDRSNVKPLYFLNEDYPQRLKDLNDAPVMMFYKGQDVLNRPNVLGVVGTRKATAYGRDRCRELIAGLAQYQPVVISGLAHGIDEIAHYAALKQGLPTVAVLGHGLQMIYPAQNENLARRMQENGGLLTEYNTQDLTVKDNFPARNRIIAGLLDGLIVVETGEKGGALITADVADSYNREVMAVPGRVGDPNAAGCHSLIKNHKAYLVEEPADVAYHLGWDMAEKHDQQRQEPSNKVEQTPEEATILKLMADHDQLHIDQIAHHSGYEVSQINVILFNMELKGLVTALPGQMYRPA
jgi:DNA processing protein